MTIWEPFGRGWPISRKQPYKLMSVVRANILAPLLVCRISTSAIKGNLGVRRRSFIAVFTVQVGRSMVQLSFVKQNESSNGIRTRVFAMPAAYVRGSNLNR